MFLFYRYLQDFIPLRSLGKGGFGVVFEAKNKLDDCSYAVKRISLPDSTTAKEKVMREVKALAKMDHVGIVRYYQAWFELPPPSWQDEKDRQLAASLTGFSLNTTPLTPAPASKKETGKLNYTESAKLYQAKHISAASSDMESMTNDWKRKSRRDKFQKSTCSFTEGGKTSDVSDSFIQFENSGLQNKESSGVVVFELSKEDSHSNNSFQVDFLSDSNRSVKDISAPAHTKTSTRRKQEDNDRVLRGSSETSEMSRGKERRQALKPKLFLYIQMQLCRQDSLRDWLSRSITSRSRTDCMLIFVQIVDAVQYVHSCGLMHRDLKPSNIFFSINGLVKIGDFGLATALAEQQDNRTCDSDVTRKHTDNVGTQLYMSPEQVDGQAYSHKVDIFSLGMIFFELLYPFSTQMERIRVLVNVKKQIFPDGFQQDQLRESEFLKKLLSREPNQRPSADEIREDPLLQDIPGFPLQHRSSHVSLFRESSQQSLTSRKSSQSQEQESSGSPGSELKSHSRTRSESGGSGDGHYRRHSS